MDLIFISTLLCILGVIIGLLIQSTKVVVAKRNLNYLHKNMFKEHKATEEILKLSRNVIRHDLKEKDFLAQFSEYAAKTVKGDGAAVLMRNKEDTFEGVAVSGIFPPLREVPGQVAHKLMAHPKKHTIYFQGFTSSFSVSDIETLCNDEGFAFFNKDYPEFFSESFISEISGLVIAPISINHNIVGCIIITSWNDVSANPFTKEQASFLVRVTELASLSLENISMFRERKRYEKRLQTAREEGMLQVSTGIIHNIGNAVTVAKLTLFQLEEALGAKLSVEDRPEFLILKEILPKMQDALLAGTLQDFLTNDDIGKQYLDITKELVELSQNNNNKALVELKSLTTKLSHMSEIIELQQRFVGELGTENLIQISDVIKSTLKIYEETCNKHGVGITTDFKTGLQDVLIDTSITTQVFINIIKNAVEAMKSIDQNTKERKLHISIFDKTLDDTKFIVTTFTDSGPGISNDDLKNIFDFGFSSKESKNGRGYGLHACKNSIEKYGGTIKVESKLNEGSTFIISFPVDREETNTEKLSGLIIPEVDFNK